MKATTIAPISSLDRLRALTYLWISIGFAISVGVGLVFGYYPANLAANLDPIVCLRYE